MKRRQIDANVIANLCEIDATMTFSLFVDVLTVSSYPFEGGKLFKLSRRLACSGSQKLLEK